MSGSTDVDEYVEGLAPETRPVLEELRRVVRETVPDAVEELSYDVPAVRRDGRVVVHFAGWAHHVSLHPIPGGDEALARDLAPYAAGNGTLQFPLDQPLPLDLVRRVLDRLVEQRA